MQPVFDKKELTTVSMICGLEKDERDEKDA
jgi:hypothetical protein